MGEQLRWVKLEIPLNVSTAMKAYLTRSDMPGREGEGLSLDEGVFLVFRTR